MSFSYTFAEEINLYVQGRVSSEDAERQKRTAREILRRLENQPGVILADEVGMGKTFVALAVAVSVVIEDNFRHPVIVMVPSSLREKWPRDFQLFKEKCLPQGTAEKIRAASAQRGTEFLKLLDDPPARRNHLIFLTHGALSRGLTDHWVKWALITRALYNRKNTGNLRRALCRVAGQLISMTWVDRRCPEVWSALLQHGFNSWLNILDKYGIEEDDDPIPEAVSSVLWGLETSELDNLFRAISNIPYRRTKNFDRKLREARSAISDEIKQLWKKCIRKIRLRLPLLILDEAHHLKNEQTRLASLFYSPDAKADAEELHRGPLAGVFERMLFLTATPFQLGHYELCSVLDRFRGISWRANSAPPCGKEGYIDQIDELRNKLDAAQVAALRLDNAWGTLRYQDLIIAENQSRDIDTWWQDATSSDSVTETARLVLKRFNDAHENMKQAEEALKPWVIRHLKAKKLPEPNNHIDRRLRLLGSAIKGEGIDENDNRGLGVDDSALLPFLLAARATVYMPESRPVFAEGLASSYEAFIYTRKLRTEELGNRAISNTDLDDDAIESHGEIDERGIWYLNKLEAVLPKDNSRGQSSHPKLGATVKKAVDLWLAGEKVLIFCHYIATGRALRQYISGAIQNTIIQLGAKAIGCLETDALSELEKIGNRFFDVDSPLRKACDSEIINILQQYPAIHEHSERIIDVVRRFLRTPSFLVRYFPLTNLDPERDAARAFRNSDSSGLSLQGILAEFLKFLVERCGEIERINYLDAVDNIQTGSIMGADVRKTYSEDEIQGDRSERFVPNVRLVNGQTKQETRRKLMLTFNTPFYPEILIASSVMGEGVDLHLSCRHVIHHDLCWNPSTLEQRTGRIDRIGAKVETCGKPLIIYIPYVAETQDEKMFRVVMDRERWFKVVMGEKYNTDARSTDKLAERIPLAKAAADFLAFRLEV